MSNIITNVTGCMTRCKETFDIESSDFHDIPAAALANLENLAKTDFKANLGKIIHDIYQTAHTMFSDMPQGDHKKRAKYRFASKTLMRILPKALSTEIEGLIEKKAITLDLYEILGQCTWGQKKVA